MEFKERKRWVFFGLPFTFTVYTITEEMITIDSGFLNKTEDDCYMYKVIDTKLLNSFWERIFKLGTIECETGDTTHPKLYIRHVRNARAIKDFIRQASEDERMRRRTINTLNLGANAVDDISDV